jgi:hypothetical protein
MENTKQLMTKRMNNRLITLTGGLLLAVAASLQAADTVKYQALPTGSEMKLEGDSTAHKWACIGKIISGGFEVEVAWQKDLTLKSVTCLGAGKTPPKCEVKVPVRTLKSQVSVGASIMDNRMQSEMNVKSYPMIEYTLTEMKLKGEAPASGSPVTFDTSGQLVVCGKTNKVSFPITMERVGADGLKFVGVFDTKMSDLGVKPPEFTVLGVGMKAHDPIKLTWTWAVAAKKD